MPEVTVIARAKAKTGKERELEQELRAVVSPTHEETGCLRYALHRSMEDPASFMVIERWTSKQALDQHLSTPHVQTLFKKVPSLVAAPPEISVFELLPEGLPEKSRL
jgi:quinol monooxygenase YgiN